MSAAENLGQGLASFIQQSQKSAEIIELLQQQVETLSSEVAELKEHSGGDGWMKVGLAAKRVGMTSSALRQRIHIKKFAEGIVWRRSDTNQVIVNLAELQKVI